MVICLERGADLHTTQRMPLPLTVSCFIKIQIGFTYPVPAHPGSPGQRAVKRVCVCVCVCRRRGSYEFQRSCECAVENSPQCHVRNVGRCGWHMAAVTAADGRSVGRLGRR